VTQTIAAVLGPALRDRRDAPAVVAPSGTLTYPDLDRLAGAAAGALWQLGVRPGGRVAACLPNDLDIVIAFHGARRPGASGLVLPHLDVAAYGEDGRRHGYGTTSELRLAPAATGPWAGMWTPALGLSG
jgi:acyl-CoA synthetase (AMP-forming)/AMP-acid ligase II